MYIFFVNVAYTSRKVRQLLSTIFLFFHEIVESEHCKQLIELRMEVFLFFLFRVQKEIILNNENHKTEKHIR